MRRLSARGFGGLVQDLTFSTQLLQECRDLAATRLVGILPDLLDKVDDALFELAEKGENNQVQTLYFDAMREVRLRRGTVESDFRICFADAVNDKIRQTGGGAARASESDGLSEPTSEGFFDLGEPSFLLVEDDELEETLAVTSMAGKVRSAHRPALFLLDKRIAFLLELAEMQEGNNPFGPEVICGAFLESCRCVEAGIEVKLLILKLFDRFLAHEMGSVYDALNDHLAANDVLRDLRPTVDVRRPETGRGSVPPVGMSPEVFQGDIAYGVGPGFVPGQGAVQMGGPMAFGQPGMVGVPSAAGLGLGGAVPVAVSAGGAIATPDAGHTLLQALQGLMQPGATPQSAAPHPAASTLISNLTRLQNDETIRPATDVGRPAGLSEGPVVFDLRSLKGDGIAAQLANSSAGAAASDVGRVDEMLVDIVAMMFEFILEDEGLAISMKELLGRLQIPLLKVAILDRSLFSRRFHPARKLLNAFAEAAFGWDEAAGRDDPLFAKMNTLVHRVLDEFEDDVGLFGEVLESFEAYLIEEERERQARIERQAKMFERRERLDQAKRAVKHEIHRLVKGTRLPPIVKRFATRYWGGQLVVTHVKLGPESEAWAQALRTLEDLVWSAQPKRTSAERQELRDRLPVISKRVRDAVRKVALTPDEQDELHATLDEIYARYEPQPKRAEPPAVSTSPERASPELGSTQLGSPELGAPELGSPELGSPEPALRDPASPELASPELASPELAIPPDAQAQLAAFVDAVSEAPSVIEEIEMVLPPTDEPVVPSTVGDSFHSLLNEPALMLVSSEPSPEAPVAADVDVGLGLALGRSSESAGSSTRERPRGRDLESERLALSISRANRELRDLHATKPEWAGMGTTVVAALLRDNTISFAHVGDSRLYRYREGRLSQLTKDHSLVQEFVQRGIYDEAEATEKVARNFVTRGVGTDASVDVDVDNAYAAPGDIYLLCSDGLSDMMDADALDATLSAHWPLDELAQRLVDRANAQGGKDNVTVVLAQVLEAFPLLAHDQIERSIRGKLRFAGATDTGQVKPQNEDSFAYCPESGLVVVADGVGGLQAGEIASGMTVKALTDDLGGRAPTLGGSVLDLAPLPVEPLFPFPGFEAEAAASAEVIVLDSDADADTSEVIGEVIGAGPNEELSVSEVNSPGVAEPSLPAPTVASVIQLPGDAEPMAGDEAAAWNIELAAESTRSDVSTLDAGGLEVTEIDPASDLPDNLGGLFTLTGMAFDTAPAAASDPISAPPVSTEGEVDPLEVPQVDGSAVFVDIPSIEPGVGKGKAEARDAIDAWAFDLLGVGDAVGRDASRDGVDSARVGAFSATDEVEQSDIPSVASDDPWGHLSSGAASPSDVEQIEILSLPDGPFADDPHAVADVSVDSALADAAAVEPPPLQPPDTHAVAGKSEPPDAPASPAMIDLFAGDEEPFDPVVEGESATVVAINDDVAANWSTEAGEESPELTELSENAGPSEDASELDPVKLAMLELLERFKAEGEDAVETITLEAADAPWGSVAEPHGAATGSASGAAPGVASARPLDEDDPDILAFTEGLAMRPATQLAGKDDGDEFDRQARGLSVGDWVELEGEDGRHVRARLSWVNQATGVLLFTDRRGLSVAERTCYGMAIELRRGTARLLETAPLYDRAVTSLLNRLRGGEE